MKVQTVISCILALVSATSSKIYLITLNDDQPIQMLDNAENAVKHIGGEVIERYDIAAILKVRIPTDVVMFSALKGVTIEPDAPVHILHGSSDF
ncbi:hypothetical protein BC833DRAFT_619427 [Globomyces pollinis-pini]|nr:hypothetical protein BC833DRAFT_619427 [Globomyces pollinis-pini]